jgi:hypothetical protein
MRDAAEPANARRAAQIRLLDTPPARGNNRPLEQKAIHFNIQRHQQPSPAGHTYARAAYRLERSLPDA